MNDLNFPLTASKIRGGLVPGLPPGDSLLSCILFTSYKRFRPRVNQWHRRIADPAKKSDNPTMQLTQYTDYSLRVLIYLARNPESPATISEIADYFMISRNHLVKVVHNLSVRGFVQATRGKGGGLRLGRPATAITIGEVVRRTEPNFHLAECFGHKDRCVITGSCVLMPILYKAHRAFMEVLDGYTLAQAAEAPLKRNLTPLAAVVPAPEAALESLDSGGPNEA
jgi:Rrf2 family nitric oxide-sensitive transcriptional repressor